ncbi:MAG: MG2 domain-containing protein, partial [Lentisphaeria bacterium]
MRAKAMDLLHKEHYAEALQQYQELLKQPVPERSFFWDDFISAETCLRHLQRVPEIDELLAEVLAHVPGDWWLHWQAGNFIRNLPAYGILQGGKFYRGEHRSSGTWINIQERNRRESLQHFEKARQLLQEQAASDSERISFFLDYAAAFLERDGNALLNGNSGLWNLSGKAWRLQQLSDLQRLPDWNSADNDTNDILGAPVNREGKTIFYTIPASYAEALSDGERFRWLLNEAGKVNANALQRTQLLLANVSYTLYGVQTLRQRGFFPFTDTGETTERGSNLLALETLSDEETIAQLANGIKRFQLPADYCYIRIYQQLADTSEPYYRSIIYQNLANIFENRRHPERALQWWQRYADCNAEAAKEKIFQITGNLGSFLPVKAQVASKAMKVEFRFRNAAQVHLKLYRLDLQGILQECKRRILKGDRKDLNYHFANLGTWLLDKKDSPFIKEKLRDWQQPLDPLPNHRDRLITLEVPVSDAGAYWLVAELPGGQISRIPLLAEQYKLLMKPLQQEMLWQLLQAESGEPVPDCWVELFVWRQSWDSKNRKNILVSQEICKKTDSTGCLFIGEKELPVKAYYGVQWLATAQVQGDKSAFVCASTQGYFYPVKADRKQPARAFVISDRPIYRPGQTLYYKAWMKQPDYVEDANPFAGTEAQVWLRTPTGEKTPLSKDEKSEKVLPELQFDRNGGLAGQYTIPDDAKLGVYRLGVGGSASGAGAYELAFRVEEYRKPEFEVLLGLPSEVPELGETFAVNVQARYYFGTPLASGKAKVKVLRYDHRGNFWPLRPWDWLYGRGYWYFGEKYDWYPGWQNWGSSPPTLFWLPARTPAAPEVVAQLDLELDHNGEASFKIDTSLAKELYGDRDHRYEISAEVSDLSRRSVVGSGQVLVGRKAFILHSWTQGGYYKTGVSITASAQLCALNGSPVSGKGTLQLFKIRYNEERLPEETQLQEWAVHTGADGRVTQQLSAAEQGQYRLAWTLSPDSKPKETVQAATVISIYGEAQASSDFRYNALELIPDKSEYAPGDTLRLRVNSEQEDSLVLLFIRPENGSCGRPQYIRLKGKSREILIPISAADMPNFFLEAILVSNGEVHHVLRSIAVPPEKKTLNLQVLPEQSRLQPGEEARIKLQLNDLEGRPFQGNIVVTVYDKSLEYLSGGSNIAAIQAH